MSAPDFHRWLSLLPSASWSIHQRAAGIPAPAADVLSLGTACGALGSVAFVTQTEVATWTAIFLSAAGAAILVYQRMEKVRREEAIEWDRVRRETLQGQLEEARQRMQTEVLRNAELTKILGEIRCQNAELLEEVVRLNKQILDILHCQREDCGSPVHRKPGTRSSVEGTPVGNPHAAGYTEPSRT
jgi:hypothetical protein